MLRRRILPLELALFLGVSWAVLLVAGCGPVAGAGEPGFTAYCAAHPHVGTCP